MDELLLRETDWSMMQSVQMKRVGGKRCAMRLSVELMGDFLDYIYFWSIKSNGE